MLRPPVKTSRHLDMKITCFGQVSFPPEGFVFQGSFFAFQGQTRLAASQA